MHEHQTKLVAGEIQFHQWCRPPLRAGDYTIVAEQEVDELKESSNSGKYSQEIDFSVAGPRFTLNPADVYSVYPPQGQLGDFANTLPHVVFTRRTLPWERSLTPGVREDQDKKPWMALLVLSAADLKNEHPPMGDFPKLESRQVKHLLNPTEKWVVGPILSTGSTLKPDGLADYENETDLCNTIDLPWQLFRQVAPSAADLDYLAHVREVNTGAKETLSFLADGWFSVVLANRFPEAKTKGAKPATAVENRAYLVSLEGMEKYLPGATADAGSGVTHVRLAVLSSWSFFCYEAFEFKSAMKALDVARIGIPWSGAAESPEEKLVEEAYTLGYSALNHATRLGDKAVSWYRGPLVPLELYKETMYTFRVAADSALRYNPIDGMMDVSYAVAFQLGRLLALQDRHFATALYAYRNGVRRQINRVLARKRVESIFDENGDKATTVMSDYLKELAATGHSKAIRGWSAKEFQLQTAPDGDSANAAQKKDSEWKTITAAARKNRVEKKRNELTLTTDFDLTIPQTVCQWLARLVLLYRVPFVNLVADERMLPRESIRFFYLDPGWIKCLLEGACSVGRTSSRDELVDKDLRDKFLDFAMKLSQQVRTLPPAKGATGATEPEAGVEASKVIPKDELPHWPLTGFLLRSPVVEGWQGLEMRAWKDSGEEAKDPLTPLRIDRLAPDIMLCIFNGEVKRIEIKQPPEGMHFGATVDGQKFKRMKLRRLNNPDAPAKNPPPGRAPGDHLNSSPEIPIPLRKPGDRVVNVSALADTLKQKLEDLEALGAQGFTSAAFAVEMVESPGRVSFDVKDFVKP